MIGLEGVRLGLKCGFSTRNDLEQILAYCASSRFAFAARTNTAPRISLETHHIPGACHRLRDEHEAAPAFRRIPQLTVVRLGEWSPAARLNWRTFFLLGPEDRCRKYDLGVAGNAFRRGSALSLNAWSGERKSSSGHRAYDSAATTINFARDIALQVGSAMSWASAFGARRRSSLETAFVQGRHGAGRKRRASSPRFRQ